MSKTEQIIDAWESAPGNSDALRAAEAMVAELRRLTKLQDAYWAECEAMRAWQDTDARSTGRMMELSSNVDKARKATDAARREAGEV